MKIDLSSVVYGDEMFYPFNGELHSTDIDYDPKEFKIVQPILVKGNVSKVDGIHLIHVEIRYNYESECDRCLKPLSNEVKTILKGRLVEEINKLDNDNEDDEYIYYEKGVLDLKEHILSEVASSLPMKSLCDTNCQGLCFLCGADLNEGSCNCNREIIDPRLEKLRNFFPEK